MKTTKGHGPGKDSVHIGTSIPVDVDKRLRRLAAASGLTRSGYAREAINDAVSRALTLRTVKHTNADESDRLGKPIFPPSAPIAVDRAGNSIPESLPIAAERPARPYTAPRRGSQPAH